MFDNAIETLQKQIEIVSDEHYYMPKKLKQEFIDELQKAILILEREEKE